MIWRKSRIKIRDKGDILSIKGRFTANKPLVYALRSKVEDIYERNLKEDDRNLYVSAEHDKYDFLGHKIRKTSFFGEDSQEDSDENDRSRYECTENLLEMNVSTGTFKAEIDKNNKLSIKIEGTREFVEELYGVLKDEKDVLNDKKDKWPARE